jgi:hypothetical protein
VRDGTTHPFSIRLSRFCDTFARFASSFAGMPLSLRALAKLGPKDSRALRLAEVDFSDGFGFRDRTPAVWGRGERF